LVLSPAGSNAASGWEACCTITAALPEETASLQISKSSRFEGDGKGPRTGLKTGDILPDGAVQWIIGQDFTTEILIDGAFKPLFRMHLSDSSSFLTLRAPFLQVATLH